MHPCADFAYSLRMRYLTEGTRLSVQVMRYDATSQKYKRNGQTRRVAVRGTAEASRFWSFIKAKIAEWEATEK